MALLLIPIEHFVSLPLVHVSPAPSFRFDSTYSLRTSLRALSGENAYIWSYSKSCVSTARSYRAPVQDFTHVGIGILFATSKDSAKSSVLHVAIINVYQERGKKTIIYLYQYQTSFCQWRTIVLYFIASLRRRLMCERTAAAENG